MAIEASSDPVPMFSSVIILFLQTSVRQTGVGNKWEELGIFLCLGGQAPLASAKPDHHTIYNHPCHSFSLLDTNPFQMGKLFLEIGITFSFKKKSLASVGCLDEYFKATEKS